jgi:hypothetical protein
MLALEGDTDTEVSVFAGGGTILEGEPPPHPAVVITSESDRKKAGIEKRRQQWRLMPIDF